MIENVFPWQSILWKQLHGQAAHRPHALLFHGQSGLGKTPFVRSFARALLCEAPLADHQACMACPSCTWMTQRSHPDFRMLRPEALDVAEGIESAEAEEAADPGDDGRKSKRAPSREIRIDQVRTLESFLGVATHRGGLRVALIYPAQAMNVFTANALLKMLEEPPPGTLFLLIAEKLDRLLPTIVSRCRTVAMPMPDAVTARQWLQAQNVDAADELLAEQGGAPLAALVAAQEGADRLRQRDQFLRMLADPARANPLMVAESMARVESGPILAWLQRWLYDCLSHRMSGRIRYYPAHAAAIAALAARAEPQRLVQVLRRANEERRVVDHPLNPRLFVESLMMDYVEAFARPAAIGRPGA